MLVAGVDEAGRGCICHDVVAAAVILDPQRSISGLVDSKSIGAKKREYLYQQIIDNALAYQIQSVSAAVIDEINILQASLLAMKQAIEALPIKPDKVLVDGNRLPEIEIPAEAIVRGDQRVAAISAASILAKVTRDRKMLQLHQQYPQYGFDKHKGYPTRAHLQALRELPLLPCYRKSYRPVRQFLK